MVLLPRQGVGAQGIGLWTVTSLVPSGNVASIWISVIVSATPSMTSALLRMFVPALMISATLLPSRAISCMAEEIRAVASGRFSLSPRALRALATSPATKINSLSRSCGVRCMVCSPWALGRRVSGRFRAEVLLERADGDHDPAGEDEWCGEGRGVKSWNQLVNLGEHLGQRGREEGSENWDDQRRPPEVQADRRQRGVVTVDADIDGTGRVLMVDPDQGPQDRSTSARTACLQLFTASPAKNAILVRILAWNMTSPRPSLKAVVILKLWGG